MTTRRPSRAMATDSTGALRWKRTRLQIETTISDTTRERIDAACEALAKRLGTRADRLRGRVVDAAMQVASVDAIVAEATREGPPSAPEPATTRPARGMYEVKRGRVWRRIDVRDPDGAAIVCAEQVGGGWDRIMVQPDEWARMAAAGKIRPVA